MGTSREVKTPGVKAPPELHEGRWRILSVLLVTVSMSLVGISIVNVALPSIQTGLNATDSDLQWVLSGYALTFGVILVAAGRAGDVLGRGGFYLLGVVLFGASSVIAGLATDVTVLNTARFVQGVGSGILNPQIIGMIQRFFSGAERGRAFGLYGTVVGLSMGLGPLVGGALIAVAGETTGWRWTFFVNVPASIVAISLAIAWFPRPFFITSKRSKSDAGASARTSRTQLDLDPVGIFLLGASILIILLPFIQPKGSNWSWMLILVGLVLAAAWVLWELHYRSRGRSPIVDMNIFRSSGFTNGVVLATGYFFGITGIWVLIALYMQQELGYSAFEAGLVGVPSAVFAAFSARWSGRHVTTYGRRIVTIGIIVAITGLLLSVLVIQLQAAGLVNIWWLLVTLSLIGVAQGSVISPNQTITLFDTPSEYAGSTGGILQTGQRIGSAIGLGVVTAIAFAVRDNFGWTAAITVSFAVIIVALALCLVVSIRDIFQRHGYVALVKAS